MRGPVFVQCPAGRPGGLDPGPGALGSSSHPHHMRSWRPRWRCAGRQWGPEQGNVQGALQERCAVVGGPQRKSPVPCALLSLILIHSLALLPGPRSLSFCVFREKSLNQDSNTNSQPLSFHPSPALF